MSKEAMTLIADIAEGSTTANSLQHIAKIARQAIAEAEKQEQDEPVAWPEPMEQPPLYADEDPAEQSRAFRYRAGWNDCLENCKARYTTPQPSQKPLTDADYVNACMSYRHDFGLMSQEQRDKLLFTAKEWARAFGLNEAANGLKE